MRKRMGIYTSFLWVQCRALALATCHSATCACNTLIFGGLLPGDHMASTPSRSHSENTMISVLPEIILCRSRLSEERIGSPSFRDGVALPTGCCVRYESEQIQNRSLPPDPPPTILPDAHIGTTRYHPTRSGRQAPTFRQSLRGARGIL